MMLNNRSLSKNLFRLAAAAAILLTHHSVVAQSYGTNNNSVAPTSAPIDAAGVSLQLKAGLTLGITDNGDNTATYTVKYEGVGWLALGVSPNGEMVGSQAVIGLPGSGQNPILYNMNEQSNSGIVGAADSEQILVSSSIEQADGVTTLSFTVPLGRTTGFAVSATGTTGYIWAHGSTNDLSYHAARGTSSTPLTTAAVPAPAPTGTAPTPTVVTPAQMEIELTPGFDLEILDNGDGTVTYELDYEGMAWIALGVSQNGQMIGSQAVIALPDSGQEPMIYNLNTKSDSGIVQAPASEQILLESSLEQREDRTRLKFTVPLERQGFFVAATGSTSYIWAHGSSNTLSYHAKRDALSVALGGAAGPAPTPSTGTTAPVAPSTAAPAPAAGNVASDGPLELAAGLTLDITDNGDDTATFVLQYEGEAWISLAVSDGGQMVGSKAVIGLPASGENPVIYNLNARTLGGVVPAETQILVSSSVAQEGGLTTLTFTVPLETEGFFVSSTGETSYLYAYGTDNTLGFHGERSSFSAALVGGAVLAEDPTNYYKMHGILMALAWGLLCPLAIGASLLRDLFPPGMFFQIHRALNTLVVLLTVIAFALAFRATNMENLDHFKEENHRKIGLVIFLFAVMQATGGFLRPHLPKPLSSSDNDKDASNLEVEPAEHIPEEKSTIRKVWEGGHRIFGLTILALAWANCTTGINRFFLKFPDEGDVDKWSALFWVMAGVVAGVVVMGYGGITFSKLSSREP